MKILGTLIMLASLITSLAVISEFVSYAYYGGLLKGGIVSIVLIPTLAVVVLLGTLALGRIGYSVFKTKG
jgi:hypothetical protein